MKRSIVSRSLCSLALCVLLSLVSVEANSNDDCINLCGLDCGSLKDCSITYAYGIVPTECKCSLKSGVIAGIVIAIIAAIACCVFCCCKRQRTMQMVNATPIMIPSMQSQVMMQQPQVMQQPQIMPQMIQQQQQQPQMQYIAQPQQYYMQ